MAALPVTKMAAGGARRREGALAARGHDVTRARRVMLAAELAGRARALVGRAGPRVMVRAGGSGGSEAVRGMGGQWGL